MQHLMSLSASDNRQEAYRLLSERAPAQVMVDDDLAPGTWFIVRAPSTFEREELARVRARVGDARQADAGGVRLMGSDE